MTIPFSVRYATESDAAALGVINALAFAGSSILTDVFPEADQAAIQAFKRIRAFKYLNDPQVHVVAGVELSTGEVVAYARWEIPSARGITPPAVPLSDEAVVAVADPMRFAPQGMNHTAFEHTRGFLLAKQKQYVEEGDIVLQMLCVLPSQQGRGVGSAMLRWGIERADAVQARIYLEATPEGYPLYCKYGWKTVEHAILDYSSVGGVGTQAFIIMIREPQKVTGGIDSTRPIEGGV